jgi:hypothetical protein
MFAYGTYGEWTIDLLVPGRHRMHLHGASAWLMYATIVCSCIAMVSIVVDHYDRRNNENRYSEFSGTVMGVGFWLGLLAIIVHFAREP